jgi:hypothetical protein
MTHTITTILQLPVEVEYEYFPLHRGHRDSLGCPEEPDEPAHVEIDRIRHDGQEVDITLNEDVLIKLEEECLEDVEKDRYDGQA